MKDEKIHRLWKLIAFEDAWRSADTSILDDLSSAWFARRSRLRLDSKAYVDFLERLKREHAIETGVVERLYDINRGVTETLIQHGFVEGFLSHGDANIPSDQLMRHLHDHMEAMDFVFDLIKEERPLTTGFIKELHQLVTRNQHGAEGRDSQGNRTKIKLLKGTFKEWENNPTRSDGTVIMYCPPVHVVSEMDQLVNIYHALEEEKIHPLIIAAWVHHAFTTIHPFQDGNGRVIRLVASLILIKHNLFPITVLREEAKLKYILALEKADAGMPSDLVSYFAVIQKRQIEKALNLGVVQPTTLDEVQGILASKLKVARQRRIERNDLIRSNRELLQRELKLFLDESCESLSTSLQEYANVRAYIQEFSIVTHDAEQSNIWKENLFDGIVQYSRKHEYHFNRLLPIGSCEISIQITDNDSRHYVCFPIHHYGHEDDLLALGAMTTAENSETSPYDMVYESMELPPHVFSIYEDDIENRMKNIKSFVEQTLTIFLADLANDFG